MTPTILTHTETRAWLKKQGLGQIRLLKRVIYVDIPYGPLWRITPHESGGYLVEPMITCTVCRRPIAHDGEHKHACE